MVRTRLGSHLVCLALYLTYIPLPLVLLTTSDGSQHVHIAPEAFKVASNEFKDNIEFWQQALPGHLKGQLASVCIPSQSLKTPANLRFFKLSGAKVLRINGVDPFVAVNENAKITGGYQAFGTRQNSYEFFCLHDPGMTISTPVSFRATAVAQPVGNTPWETLLYWRIH